MITQNTHRVADIVGAVTIAIGTALTVAPRQAGPRFGLGQRPGLARTIGGVDLALAPGLLGGRPRWPWMGARATLNLALAAHYLNESRRGDGAATARKACGGMLALTAFDAAVAGKLRIAENHDARSRLDGGSGRSAL